MYLIAITILIALISTACKSKPTQTSDFSGFDENVAPVNPTRDFTQFLGKTIRSKEPITQPAFYFWAKFTDEGISYGQGTDATPSFVNTIFLEKSALSDKAAKFSGNTSSGVTQKGTITFTDDGTSITSIVVKLEEGTSYDGQTISCQFVNE